MMNKKFYAKKINDILVIAPRRPLLDKVLRALVLVKKTDPREYKKIKFRLKLIFITRKSGYNNEFFMPEKIWFANTSLIKNNDLNWLASLIIHEAFHATQFKQGKYILPLDKLEPLAHQEQEKFLKKLGEDGRDARVALNQKQWQKLATDKISFAYFRHLLEEWENDRLEIIKVGARG